MIDFRVMRKVFTETLMQNLGDIPLQTENIQNKEGSAIVTAKNDKKLKWARLTIRHAEPKAITIGSNILRRYQGIAIIELYYPIGSGTDKMSEKASQLATAFLSAECGQGVTMFKKTPMFSIIGNSEGWFQGNLTVPFEYDQFDEAAP